MGIEDFSVTLDLGFGDDFGVSRDSVFINDLWFWSSPRVLKISASAVEVSYGDGFEVYKDSAFVNDLWFWHRPGALKISTSLWIWVSGMISGSPGTQFSTMICDFEVVHGCWRFQRQRWKFVLVIIYRSTRTQFSLMIYDSNVVYWRWRLQRHSGSWFRGWFQGLQGRSFC